MSSRDVRHFTSRKSLLLLGITVMLGFLATGIRSEAQPPRTVKIGTFKLAHMMAPWFYDRFAPSGIKFEVYPFPDAMEIEKSVARGTLDFGMYGGVPTLLGVSHGDPIVIVASAANGGAAIVVRKEAAWASLKDLRGRRIAYWPGSYQHLLLVASLQAHGMTVKDVDLIKVPWAEMPLALQRGDIDAYIGSEPGPTKAVMEGYGRILEYPYKTALRNLNSAYSTRRELVEREPELVQAVVLTHRRAVDFMNQQQREWTESGFKLFGIDRAVMRESLKNLEAVWDIDDKWVDALKAQGRALVDVKFIEREPAWEKLIDRRFVDRARVQK